MTKINILDSSVFNRIAAGEVVESPVSAVKELIENSIDANAKNITIEIKNGGIDYIRISDDGCGMDPSDIEKAFLPHATSKIKSISDLESIQTLGFRGEALPSIASVAKVSITSRIVNSETGYCVTVQNGKKIFESEIGAPLGTTVTVENIFENVPARKKFLKKPAIEGAKIADLVQKLILANFNVSFKFINNGETIYHSSGKDLTQSIYTIYGDTIKNLDYIEASAPDMSIKGYISKPSFSKHNKSYQTLIVNGRVVENEDISFYIYLCYQDILMKRQYPMFILYIDLPFDMIDVNVHPNKMNVKFSDLNKVKNYIMGAVKKSINKEFLIPKNIEKTENIINNQKPVEISQILYTQKTEKIVQTQNTDKINAETAITSDIFKNSSDYNSLTKDYSKSFNNIKTSLRETKVIGGQKNSEIPDNEMISNSSLSETENKESRQAQSEIINNREYVLCGKIFNTYLILQENENVYLIDQHAAHEKILYDKLIAQIDNKIPPVQNLLLPFIFEVTGSEKIMLLEKTTELNSLGFSVSQYGENIFSLSAVPVLCININLREFVFILMENLKKGQFKKSDFIKESVMQAACKAAVKGYDDLSKNEAEILIEKMIKSGGALFCPHGRPIVVKLSKPEIEKWFKRI